MHVAGNSVVELAKFGGDFGIFKEDWRVDNGDFGLFLGEFSDELLVEVVEVGEHDIEVFAARIKDGGAAIFFVVVKFVIVWRLGEAENVGIFVFVGFVVENVDVLDVFDSLD